ncbi:hypothetical protein ACJ72_08707 [Emergomyces africanus]|uniref:Uncharacterized protein n=1 Tax=Emergomyces africanus TaxID=1955775 RepID=A0A1B7NJF1_9EURO|nr:hypothetical protein ACJ72_08707 [Emergomyces africanus]
MIVNYLSKDMILQLYNKINTETVADSQTVKLSS